MMPKHWRILLDGFPDESGDVITRDGEIIGTWYLIDDVFHAFTPNGEEKHLFFEPFVGILCHRIADWHEQREAAALGPAPCPLMVLRRHEALLTS